MDSDYTGDVCLLHWSLNAPRHRHLAQFAGRCRFHVSDNVFRIVSSPRKVEEGEEAVNDIKDQTERMILIEAQAKRTVKVEVNDEERKGKYTCYGTEELTWKETQS